MKHPIRLLLVGLFALGFVGCEKAKEINEDHLLGYWHEASTNTYMRFMKDANEMMDGYYLGYEWDADENTESNVRDLSRHSNGWYEWYITKETKKSTLTLIHLFNGKKIPKVYTIKDLTEARLEYIDEENVTYTLSKTTQPR